jgi:hypothetical protein
MKYFYITSSELAKLTGHNRFDPLDKTVNGLLKKFGLKTVYVPKTNVEAGLHTLTPSQLSILNDELIQFETTIRDPESCIKQYIIQPCLCGELTEEDVKELLAEHAQEGSVLQVMMPYIAQDVRMRRGNVKEHTNLETLQTKKAISVTQRNSQMYTKQLLRTDTYCLVLRGKVDGIADDTIIEAKSRHSKLFMELRDYERVQLEAYMFLTGFTKSTLTEHYNDTSHQINYSRDEDFWNTCVASTKDFIDTHIVPHMGE